MKVSSALESKGVKDSAGVLMMPGIVSEIFNKFGLGRFPMLKLVHDAGRGGHKVAKVGIEGIIGEQLKYRD